MISLSKITHVVLDVDDNLYSRDMPVMSALTRQFPVVLSQMLGIPIEQANQTCALYYSTYGSTLEGVMRHHPEIDGTEFLQSVHKIEHTELLPPNKGLSTAFRHIRSGADLPITLFTNGTNEHGHRCAQVLGVRPHIDYIIGIDDAPNLRGKPHESAYNNMLQTIGLHDHPDRVLFVDDSLPNVRAAQERGIQAVQMYEDPSKKHLPFYQTTCHHGKPLTRTSNLKKLLQCLARSRLALWGLLITTFTWLALKTNEKSSPS
jgi:putative hydrolase of the HAD superfamily